MTAELHSQVWRMAHKRGALFLCQGRWRTCCRYPTALPRGSILTQRNRAGAILLSSLLLLPLFLQGLRTPFIPSHLLCALMLYAVFYTMSTRSVFSLLCPRRVRPALRAASLQWEAVQQVRFVFIALRPLMSYYAYILQASAYRQEKTQYQWPIRLGIKSSQ